MGKRVKESEFNSSLVKGNIPLWNLTWELVFYNWNLKKYKELAFCEHLLS